MRPIAARWWPLAVMVALVAPPVVALMVGPFVFATPYWMACIACALLAMAARFGCGTWLHPAPLFAATWVLYLAVPVFLVRDLSPAPTANALIVLSVGAVAIPVAATSSISDEESIARRVMTEKPLTWIVVAAGFTGIAAAMLASRNAGFGFFTPFGLSGLRRAGLEIAVSRYAGVTRLSLIEIALLAITYAGAVLAPFAAASYNQRSRRLLLRIWPTTGAMLFSVATTARQAMLVAAALTLAGTLMVASVRGGGRARVSFRSFLGVLVGGAAVAGAFVFAAFSRVSTVTGASQAVILSKLGTYVGGSIPALNAWLEQGNLSDGIPWTARFGGQTFAGVPGLIGFGGGTAYPNFVHIEADGLAVTNVFTLFRQMVTDYSFGGSVIVLAAASTLAAVAWRAATTTGRTWPLMSSVAFIAAGFYSATGSLFASTNICAGLIMATIAMRLWCRFPAVPRASSTAEQPAKGDFVDASSKAF